MKILFIGRKNDNYSYNFFLKLKKISKKNQINSIWSEKKRKLSIKKNYDFIICYRNYKILNSSQLCKAKKYAINLHPGPPTYRGIGCLNYALFNLEKKYGFTIHLMKKKIDSGKIIFKKDFKISKEENVDSLLTKVHKECSTTGFKIIRKILLHPKKIEMFIKKNKNINWSNTIKNNKALDKFYEINLTEKIKKLFYKKIRSTYYKNFKPYIVIKDKRYYLHEQK